MPFSLDYYRAMLFNLLGAGRTPITIAKALDLEIEHASSRVVLRHDVDRFARRAVAMAELEHDLGIQSTYYFRCTRTGRFPSDAIRTIAELGHEVGYHYETLSQFGGSPQLAVKAFIRNLSKFRQVAPCQTISMHGAPLSRHDNQDLIEHLELTSLHIKGDAVRDMRRLHPVYVTDTGGNWNLSGHRNRRDVAGEIREDVPDFLDAVALSVYCASLPRLLYINSHPERWPNTMIGRMQVVATDMLSNIAKRVVRLGT